MSNLNDFVIENGVLKKYTGIGDNIIIPNIVTVIDCEAFRRCTNITSITIPDSVTSIGDGAFWGCKSLTSITIPDSVTSIGDNAFWGCENLTSITIPDSVSTIGNEAFEYCKGLTYIKIPDSVTTIGDGAFSCCENLTSITIPDNVSILGNEAFKYCEGLADEDGFVVVRNILYDYYGDGGNISIPNGVTTINNYAFYECKNLVSLTIPDSVTSIGDSAFSECENLSSIIVPNSITSIGENAFEDCKKLSDFTFPSKLKLVSKSCFENSGLTSVKLTESIEFIDDWAFAGIRATEVEIPKTVKSIGLSIFAQVPNITVYDSMDVDAKSAEDFVDDTSGEWNGHVGSMGLHYWRGCVEMACHSYWYDHTITVKSVQTGDVKYRVWMCGEGESRKVWCSLASSWGKNAEFAFNYFDTKIFSLFKVFDNKIINAFYRLHYKYNLSDENEKKYRAWFKKNGAKVLLKLVEWDNIEMLAELIACDIITANNIDKAIDLANEKGRTEILSILMNYKHTHFSMDELEKAEKQRVNKELQAPIEPKIDWRKEFTFKAVDGGTAIIKYGGSSTDVIVPDVVNKKRIVEIADGAFSTHRYGLKGRNILRNIVSITLPESICRIGEYAFRRCEKLASINIPEGVVSIGNEAFMGCKGLISIQIPNSVSKIGLGAFSKCTKLATITIPGSVSEIDIGTFRDCAKLKTVVLENGVESVGEFAFANCGKLELVTIPKSVTSIDKTAFLDCNNLTIRTPAGSYAEQYAKTNNINFVTE